MGSSSFSLDAEDLYGSPKLSNFHIEFMPQMGLPFMQQMPTPGLLPPQTGHIWIQPDML